MILVWIVKAHPVTEVRLNELARERTEAIKQEFVAAGTIDEGRLTSFDPQPLKKGPGKPYLPSSPSMFVVERKMKPWGVQPRS